MQKKPLTLAKNDEKNPKVSTKKLTRIHLDPTPGTFTLAIAGVSAGRGK